MAFAVNTITSPFAPLDFATVFARVGVKGYAERLVVQPSTTSAREIEREKKRQSEEKECHQSPFRLPYPDEFHKWFNSTTDTQPKTETTLTASAKNATKKADNITFR